MRTFISFIKEDADPKQQDVLKNPSLMHNNYNEALTAAKKMSSQQTNPTDRAYILKYKYYQQGHVKQYTVVYNKTLLSQAPNWEQKSYTIIGWVSITDGVVIRTPDGKYVKDQGQ
jgi:hypothetical protein